MYPTSRPHSRSSDLGVRPVTLRRRSCRQQGVIGAGPDQATGHTGLRSTSRHNVVKASGRVVGYAVATGETRLSDPAGARGHVAAACPASVPGPTRASAGDFLLSELVGLLPDISTGELIAPATTMETFARTYKPMLDWSRMQRLTVTALEDQSERADRVGGYNESILCLAANVLAVEAVDSDDRFNWGPLSGQHEVAMDEMDEWATETLRVEPEPIIGMQRFLAQDPQIDALRTNGALGVEVVAGLSHEDLVTDTAVWTEVIGRLERPRTSRRPVHNPRVPFVTPWTREDPLARAQRELRERRQG